MTFEITAAGLRLTDDEGQGNEPDRSHRGLFFDARWFAQVERKWFGFSAEVTLSDVATKTSFPSFTSPFERRVETHNVLATNLSSEARGYLATDERDIYAFGALDASVALETLRGADFYREATSVPGEVQLAAGLGAGRILSIDPSVRLRRIEKALAATGALRGPISRDVGTNVIQRWHAMRYGLGNPRALVETTRALQDAGLVTGGLDRRSSNRVRAILADPYIVRRQIGWDVRFGIGALQEFIGYDEEGRYEDTEPPLAGVLVGAIRVEWPVSTIGQLSVRADGRYEMGDPGTEFLSDFNPREWGGRGIVDYTHVFYGHELDPRAALTLSAEVELAGVRPTSIDGRSVDAVADALGRLGFSVPLRRGLLAGASVAVHGTTEGGYQLMLDFQFAWNIASSYCAPYVVRGGM
jgi:hypothetical protein